MIVFDGDLKEIISHWLSNEWICIFGDSEFVSFIEEYVYTPGTDKHENFMLLRSTDIPFNYIAFGKKTKELKELLNSCMNKPPNYDKLIAIDSIKETNGSYNIFLIEKKSTSRAFVEALLNQHY